MTAKTILRVAQIGPLGGAGLASGQVKMVNEVQSWKREGYLIQSKFFPWENWQQAGEWLYTAKIKVICGYSNGGCSVTWIPGYAEYREPVGVDLLIGLDPTLWIYRSPIPSNVKKAVCYYNANYFVLFPTQFVGHGKYSLTQGNKTTNLITKTIYDWHGNVDKNPQRQAEIYSMIKALMK